MPEGMVGEQTGKPLHERYGFESEDAMAEAFDALKGDVKKYNTEARGSKELQDKLTALEAERAKAAEAEMSEVQKLQKRMAEYEKALAERDARVAEANRAVLTERVFSQKLAGRSPEEAAVLRRLYASAVAGQGFADEAELSELLSPVEADYVALRKAIGVPAGDNAGGAPGIGSAGMPMAAGMAAGTDPKAAALAKDYMGLSIAAQVERARKALFAK
jgi:hypothetical protein